MNHRRPLIESLEPRRLLSTMTVDFNAAAGELHKPGLGSLFGAVDLAGGTDKGLLDATTLTLSAPMDRPGQVGANPFSLARVAPLVRGTDAKLIVRFADMLSGFPYNWQSLADWDAKVDFATHLVSDNYKDVLRAVAVFNEPDANFGGNFLSDPAIAAPAGNKYARINWLWTHTATRIRGIDASIPLMGPNYLYYNPQLVAGEGTVMRDFLRNARDTNTLPDLVGWHPLLTDNPADVRYSVNAYRATEDALGVSDRPIVMEEYGINNGRFAGVPSALLPFWAEMERSGVAFGAAGVYDNGGTLGNIARYWSEADPQVNAGFFLQRWYHDLDGTLVPTSPGASRYVGAYDGVASWDAASGTATVLLAGPDDRATLALNGVAAKLGNSVRVRVEMADWTRDTNEPNTTLEHGGDPITAPVVLFDRVLTPDANGNLSLPLHVEDDNGYRVTLTRAAAENTAGRYEAEHALVTHAAVRGGAGNAGASHARYVGGIDFADSAVSFTVTVPAAGSYNLAVGYAAAAGAATHVLSVNGASQGSVSYAATAGWLNATRAVATRAVTLKAGVNTIRLAKGNGYAELDYLAVNPAAPYAVKYEAEQATLTNVATYAGGTGAIASGTGYVGGINGASNRVTFQTTVPAAGLYDLTVRYAAAQGSATHALTVNGQPQGEVAYDGTAGWSGTDLRATTKLVALQPGPNAITFTKGSGYAELDFVSLAPDTHRYEAAGAARNSVSPGHFPYAYTWQFHNYVGGINDPGDSVTFDVDAPAAGNYAVKVAYANGTNAAATHAVSLNGIAAGTISYVPTGGWFGTAGPVAAGRAATINLSLRAGRNAIKLEKAAGFAELQYLTLVPAPAAPAAPSAPALAAGSDSGASAGDNLTNVRTPTLVGTAAPDSAVTLQLDGVDVGSTIADDAGHWSVAVAAPLDDGSYTAVAVARNAGAASSVSAARHFTVDTVAPVLTGTFRFETGQSVALSAAAPDALAAVAVGGLSLVNLTTGQSVAATRDGAAVTFAGGTLADGDYRLTGTAADAAGNAGAFAADFFVLAGDADRDRVVGVADFLLLRRNFGTTGGSLFSEGDFDNDGRIGVGDFVILRRQFGKRLPPLGSRR